MDTFPHGTGANGSCYNKKFGNLKKSAAEVLSVIVFNMYDLRLKDVCPLDEVQFVPDLSDVIVW
jgi:hypothetical protein